MQQLGELAAGQQWTRGMTDNRDLRHRRHQRLNQAAPHQAPDSESEQGKTDGDPGIAEQITAGLDEELPLEIQVASQQPSRDHRPAAQRKLQRQRAQNRCDARIAHRHGGQRSRERDHERDGDAQQD